MQIVSKTAKGRASQVTDWSERVIVGDRTGGHDLPAWLADAYGTFREQVIDPAFPCFFGTQAERRGEMFYSYVEGGDLSHLPATMARFVELSALRQNEKNNFAIFFEPDEAPLHHDGYQALFWRVLQHLHDHDPAVDPTAPQHDPDHPDWEFAFAGVQMFVVGCTPSYLRRRSRNLGRGMIFLFQPRSVFVDLVTQKAIGPEARGEVRRRLLLWDDGVGAHADLGVYGDTENREWKQYFLPDGDAPITGACPFMPRRQAPASDLVALLRRRAAEQPGRTAIRFLVDGEAEEAVADYAGLDRRARLFARSLLKQAQPGDRVMLLLPSGIDYAVAFFACLYAGLIAVPAYPADTVNRQAFARLQAMLRDAGPRLLVTDAAHAGLVANLGAEAETVVMGVLDGDTAWQPLPVAEGAIAFLQYTSGSTASPKGVMVGHRHLLANLAVLRSGFGLRPDDVMVSWLPLYHDMGLIAGMLSPIFCGFPLVLMAPQHFLGSPARWLRAMSRYGGTVGGAPDFAFQLCVDRIGDSQLAGITLERWRMAWCGAEPIRLATMAAFAARFADIGFDRNALYPCYGLAEATLMVSGNRRGDGPLSMRFSAEALAQGRAVPDPDGAALMDCGVAHDGHAIRIVDPASGQDCAAGTVGEIRYAGPSVAGGYWRKPNDDAFAGTELRTGDLGFLHDGKLFVCGRLKDLIIIRGQNLYPQDIEQTVSAAVEGPRQGRIAAFPVDIDGVEGIGIAAEMPRARLRQLDAPAVFRAIGGAVAANYQEPVALILLLAPGDLPRTSSGKLQRSACLPRWRSGALQPAAVFRQGDAAVDRIAPRDAREAEIAAIWRALFAGRDIGVTEDFFAIGGQSIAAARLVARLSDQYGVAVPLRLVFEAPTIAAQARRLAADHLAPLQPIAPRSPGLTRLPLSPVQERLWFLWRLAPDDTAYVVAGAIRLTGRLDVARLRRALSGVVARHEALRTRFVEDDGAAWQVVSDAADYGWAEDGDLAVQPFDLEHGPLLRAILSTVGPDQHELLLSMHHIVSDGWSIPILLKELSALYAGADLAPLPIQYGDYALWQRQRLDERAAVQTAYWRNRLGTGHPDLPLPTRSDRPGGHGAQLTVKVPAELAARLRQLSSVAGTTLFTTLLGGFAVLLHRYSGQRDIRIGVPSAGRQQVETEGLIGFFVNTLVLRAELSGAQAFADLVAQLREGLLEAQANQDLPFERLVAELNPERGAGGNPLARVKFLLQEDWQAIEGFGDLAARPVDLPAGAVRFDLALDVTVAGQGLDCRFTYDIGLFAAEAIGAMAERYVSLLGAIAGDAAQAVAALPLIGDEVAPVRAFAGDLLSRLARRDQGVALMHQGASLDWPGLWQWSGRLAGRLCALGVGPEVPVAVALPRGPALVASLLAIWRAGGVYLPLDPALPGERLAWQVADSAARLLIAEGRPDWCGIATVGPDEAGEPPALVAPLPDQAAYVIYTSGSTGRPKGVVVSHGALTAYVQAVLERLPDGIASAAYVSTPAADLGHTVLLGALWAGWTLHLIDGPTAFDPDGFADYMRRHQIDALKIVPSHLGGLLQARQAADVLPQRCLILGGEATAAALAARIAALKPGCRMVNHYGPTETTVGVLTREGQGTPGPSLPLGRPLAHARVVVLDGCGNRLPDGMAGEICIGGQGVARGYLGRAALTAERFLPEAGGGRLYRTGDRGRVLPGGEIDFLGRLDDQVKIRGYRVEPEEAAGRLRALPGVREAAVIARADDAGRMRLVGYAAGDGLDGETLRAGLGAVLPDYLVPAAIVVLDRLPLTSNGKVDRAALPEPVVAARQLVAPRNDREATLLAIWQEVLKREDIGVTENFFALGGDSILSLQVVAQARRAGLKLTPKQVFDRPDIAGLAALAGTVVAKPAAAALPPVDRRALGLDDPAIADVYPATGLQQGLIYHSLMRPADGVYVNQLRLTLRGPVDEAGLRAAWTAAVARHDILRTGFDWRHGGAAVQVVRRAVDLPWTSHDWSARPAYEADLAAWRAADVARGFDLARPPLLRLALFRRPDGDGDLIWTNHHAVTDGWSSARLLAEIAQGASGPAPSYRAYVAWAHAQPSGEDWWRAQAARTADPAGLTVALGRPRRPVADMRRLSRDLAGLAAALEASARRHAVTLNTLMQGAWALVLSRHAGRGQVAFGITVAGRPAELAGADHMLGLFINSLPLWLDLPGGQRLAAWLQDLQAHNVALRQHEHTSLSDLQRWTGRSGDGLFDSLLVFQNFPLAPDLFDKAGLRAVEIGVRTHYPLTLTITPGAGARLDLAWDGERFDAADIDLLVGHYFAVLEQLAQPDDPCLRDITLAADPIARPATYAFDAVPQRFARQAALRPLAEAVVCGDERVSYGALEGWSNRIGRRLRRLGVGAEERVGLCIERSAGLAAGLLGILKAGGAYVPLDPAYPEARLAEMIGDAGVRRVVVDATTAARFPDLELVRIDAVEAESAAGWCEDIDPDQLAYVIYTSGSTGRPKGVAISHGALSLHMNDFIGTYAVTADDVVLQLATISFDVGSEQLLPPLLTGARVVMRGPELLEPAVLNRILVAERVSVAGFATAYWQQWLHDLPDQLPALRLVMVGGEALPGDALRRWQAGPLAGVRLDNLYGPTETTVTSCLHPTGTDDADSLFVAIGHGFPGRSVAVVDTDGNLAPMGELCIGGDSVGRGYLDRPGLTAERFVPDPWRPGGRLYRTGDLCRRRADGTIEFLGRLDAQVKLRGYRIELGEVEAALRACEGVKASAAAIKGEGENRRLVGYAVGDDLDADALKAALAAKLPDYLVPSVVVLLDALPLMPNGKTNAAALPEPAATERDLVAPRDEREAALLSVWRGVLKRDDIGVTENFFALGGDSILSLQVVARARQAGLRLTPKQLFEEPTIAALAAMAGDVKADIVEDVAGDIPLTPIQSWFFERHPAGENHWNQAVLLKLREELDLGRLRTVLNQLVVRHDALRLRFDRRGDGWHQTVSASSLVEIEVADVEDLAEAGTALQRRLDITHGPLLRVGYFRLPDGERRLLLAIHHLAVDGVSWRVLLEELQQAYAGSELPPPSTSWASWAKRLHAYGQTVDELGWWRERLSQAKNLGLKDGDRKLSSSKLLTFRLDEAATAKLLAAAPRAYRLGVDELLLAALVQAAGQGLLVEVEGHGREDLFDDVDLSRTVGWFTTSYPVWLADGSPIAVKEALRSVPMKGLHWGLLRARDLPVPDVSFNYLGRFERQDGLFGFAEESVGQSLSGDLPHALQINGAIVNGCLALTWRYSPDVIDPAVVEAMFGGFGGKLEALVEHCLTARPKPTASDYPLAGLTQDQFEAQDLGEAQDIYPATALQQGLIYHSLLNPNDGVYVNQLRLTLKGPIDAAALKAAWAAAVARHDILRTAFEWRHGGEALQVVRAAVDLPWVDHDGDDLATWRDADIARGFDLSAAPLLRLALFRRPDGDCDLVVTNHHAITDGWSSAQLLAEVAQAYRGHDLPAPATAYRSYVAWSRRQPSGEGWWREQAGDAAGLTASLGRPVAAEPGTHRLEQHLPELGERLRQAARRRSVTLNTLMQGAWALVLARHAGQARVGFGVTVSGRPAGLPGVERMQGLFINSLPLWVDLPAAQPLDGWLQDLQARNVAMRQYEHVSLSDLQRWTGRSGDALFDSLLVFENYPVDEAVGAVRDLLGVIRHDSLYRTHYPLSVVIEPAQGLRIRWTWDGTRLERTAVARLAQHYQALLGRLADAGDPALGGIALAAPATTAAVSCAFQPVMARINALPPAAVAVTADGGQLTYGDLAAWSNRIGRRLKRLGITAEGRVGLCLQRSAGLVAAVLGVLKSGGAYVPLDPGYPAERVVATIVDAGLRVMVTDRATLAALPGLFDGLAIVLVEDVADENDEGWVEDVRADQLAYVIYTSGSTGRPKGVGVTHGNLARLLTATKGWFHFGAGDVWTLFHSCAFDFSVWEIFGCLCHGGCLVVVPGTVARDPEGFHALLRREGVTVLNQTPSAILPLMQADLVADHPADALRVVIFGGEKLEPAALQRWLAARGPAAPRLVNMYGITETTVHVTGRPIARADTEGDAPRSVIGTAIPDLALHLLDSHGNAVPVGGVGELHVGGAGLARGYLGRPGLTAERFVPDPFGPPGARLYRSGDLGRRLADGDVDYLGRNDAQVKIRGHRIELGEIQATLSAHPAVREAAVLAADERLVAYVVADGIGAEALREHLARRLPGYMLPAGFVFLDALPLTSNGKLDRQALPALLSAADGYEAPRTATETMLCQLWAGLLGRDRVGRADDFFALGGHSLLAVRMVARLSDALGRKVELRLLFDHPAVASLAAVLDRDGAADGDAAAQMNDLLDALAG